jgi:hypothetical protein
MLVLSILREVRYIFDELKEEKELSIMDPLNIPPRQRELLPAWEIAAKQKAIESSQNFTKKKPVIMRNGVPQGLPISPLLATLALEVTKTPPGLVMYADDGLIFGENREAREN